MHRIEGLAASFMQDGDEIYNMRRALDRPVYRPAYPQIGLNRLNLADIAQWLEMPCKIGPPAGNPHQISAPRQSAHDMAAKETGAPENRDKLWGLQDFGHS
jgi:hypothetical protein